MIRYIITLLFLLLGCVSCTGPVKAPHNGLYNNLVNVTGLVTYVDTLDLDSYAFAYTEMYGDGDIYIKRHNALDRVLMFVSGLSERGVLLHELGHSYDWYMYNHDRIRWVEFNSDRYDSVYIFDDKRAEHFAEDVRKTLLSKKRNALYRYLQGE